MKTVGSSTSTSNVSKCTFTFDHWDLDCHSSTYYNLFFSWTGFKNNFKFQYPPCAKSVQTAFRKTLISCCYVWSTALVLLQNQAIIQFVMFVFHHAELYSTLVLHIRLSTTKTCSGAVSSAAEQTWSVNMERFNLTHG